MFRLFNWKYSVVSYDGEVISHFIIKAKNIDEVSEKSKPYLYGNEKIISIQKI